MIYKLRYTPLSRRDLEEIWDNIFEVSQDYDIADQYVTGIMNTISIKKEFPKSGKPLEYRGLFTGFYSVNYKAYIVFYRIRDEYIEVARIIMMKRDYMKILFE